MNLHMLRRLEASSQVVQDRHRRGYLDTPANSTELYARRVMGIPTSRPVAVQRVGKRVLKPHHMRRPWRVSEVLLWGGIAILLVAAPVLLWAGVWLLREVAQ